jgi:hypothetical protein
VYNDVNQEQANTQHIANGGNAMWVLSWCRRLKTYRGTAPPSHHKSTPAGGLIGTCCPIAGSVQHGSDHGKHSIKHLHAPSGKFNVDTCPSSGHTRSAGASTWWAQTYIGQRQRVHLRTLCNDWRMVSGSLPLPRKNQWQNLGSAQLPSTGGSKFEELSSIRS